MTSSGTFEHIGHADVRMEGQTAWGVWLRVNYWIGAHSRRPRLRCGVFFHVANRTVSFHGSVSDARNLLLPLFADWTASSMADLPSARPPLPPLLDDVTAPEVDSLDALLPAPSGAT